MATGPTVEERLARLERAVLELQRTLAVNTAAPEVREAGTEPPLRPGHDPAAASGQPRPAAAAAPVAARPIVQAPPPPPRDWVALGQLWIGRAGLAILVLGLVFLFRYAVVRGWVVPELRVALGVIAGAVLLAAGLRLHGADGTHGATANRAYGLLLLGGGVGVLYLSAYAAFGFYRLVSAGVALAVLAVLALLAVRLAANREEVLLAHLGAVGAFLAPVLVQSPRPSIPLLAGYIVLVVAWTGWTAVREGWRLLAWTAAAGAALLLALGRTAAPGRADRVALAAAAAISGVGLMAGLLWRLRAAGVAGAVGEGRPVPAWVRETTVREADILSAAALAVAVAILLPIYVAWVLRWPQEAGGLLVLAGAVVLGTCAWEWRDDGDLARALAVAAALPLLVGTALLDLTVHRGAFALEALALLIAGRRAPARALAALGHMEFGLVAMTFLALFLRPVRTLPLPVLVTDLVALGAALYATRFLAEAVAVRIYAVAALLGLLGWLMVALLPLAGGQYWVTSAWFAVGALLFLGAWWRSDTRLRVGALIALAAVTLKLLLVDTARLPAGGRVVVFLVFGALIVLLGAFFQRGARRARAVPAAPPSASSPASAAAPGAPASAASPGGMPPA